MSDQTVSSPQAVELQVSIRMYRPGLGDCFLLRVRRGRLVRNILIDCGVLQYTPGGKERLGMIIQDIRKATRGRLHVLVATHEHTDHLAGFLFHEATFRKNFKINQVWMPWTENKEDPEVKETYRQYWKIAADTLDIALKELEKKGKDYLQYKELMDFLSPGSMDTVKNWGKKQLYLSPQKNAHGPTTVLTIDEFPYIKVHVLGPPNDLQSLKRGDPPKTKHQLDKGEAINQSTALSSAVFQMGYRTQDHRLPEGFSESDILEYANLSLPFDRSRGLALNAAANDPGQVFFHEYYGTEKNSDQEWRRIDTDWLGAIGSLALDLDNDINNTSLVLGFELLPSKKVLLFSADAQYGNWKSWTDTPKGRDLLKRVVFYKVGHHGSHNATQLEDGLLLMDSEELVSMIPVDIEQAKSKNWKMPAAVVATLLNKMSKGRIITAIEEPVEGIVDPSAPYKLPGFPKDALISRAEWQDFTNAIQVDDSPDHLWVEFTIQG